MMYFAIPFIELGPIAQNRVSPQTWLNIMANLEFLVPLNLGFAFTLLQTIQAWVERQNVEQSFLYKETTQ